MDGPPVGYIKQLATMTVGLNDLADLAISLMTPTTAKAVADAAGFAQDATNGSLIGQAAIRGSKVGQAGGYEGGVTMTLTPAGPKGATYFGVSGLPDPALTWTTTAGLGLGVFGGLTPGEYVVTFANKTCYPEEHGWSITSTGQTRVLVVAGYVTSFGVYCN